jgi:acyl carrier protein
VTRDEIFAALKAAVADETGGPASDLTFAMTAAEVPGWDSLAHIRIVMNLEARTGAEIDMDKTYRAATIGDLIDLVCGG